ncbi:MAG: hypothetical protein GX799_05480 [Crenarchaeota archaeon]|nr:hypothetical protein [Thermoproteota archaeon]
MKPKRSFTCHAADWHIELTHQRHDDPAQYCHKDDAGREHSVKEGKR